MEVYGSSLVVQWLRLQASTAGGTGLTPGGENKILHVTWHGQKKKKKRFKPNTRGFPGGAVVKNPPANAGDMDSSPGLGRSHMCGATKLMRHNY